MEDRIEKLETQIAFQEDLLDKLNQALIQQQMDIRRLTRIIERMSSRLDEVAPESVIEQSLETPPPHY